MSNHGLSERTRRGFLRDAICGAAVCAAGGFCLVSTGCAPVRHVTAERVGRTELRVPANSFGEYDGLLVYHDSLTHPVYVHRAATDRRSEQYTAVVTTCTHRACEVEPAGDRLVCPCHGSEFTHDGDVLDGPADVALIALPIERVDEYLVIQLTEKV